MRRLLDRAASEGGGEVFLALYELHDPELVALLKSAVKGGQVHLILSTAGTDDPNPKGTPKGKRKSVVWDTENNNARLAIHRAEPKSIRDRMFNKNTPIGHDKFAVYVKGGVATTVMTGSTNWTETGLCTQSNNVIIIENNGIAKIYLEFWHRLAADPQSKRKPLTVKTTKGTIAGAEPNNAIQGQTLRKSNMRPFGPVALPDGVSR